jgi:hypothetical protein
MAALGFAGLSLSCLGSALRWLGASPSDLGFLSADGSLPVELFAWAFFSVALLLALRTSAARGASIYVRAGAAVCLAGAIVECTSVGFSVRTVTEATPPLSLFKAEFTFASLGWLLLAIGVFILQRNWSSGRQLSIARTARGAWQRALLVVTIALLCSAAGEALGFGSLVAWPRSTSEPALLASFAPEVLTWIAFAGAAWIVLVAARRGLFARPIVVPAGLAALGGVVLTASTAAVLVAAELVFHFFNYGWTTRLLRIQTVGACVGMLILAGACVAAAAMRQHPGSSRHDALAQPAYWPRVAAATP